MSRPLQVVFKNKAKRWELRDAKGKVLAECWTQAVAEGMLKYWPKGKK